MWLHSHSQNDSRNNNANDIQTTKRMKLNTLHLLETTEQELNIMSEVETTRRVFFTKIRHQSEGNLQYRRPSFRNSLPKRLSTLQDLGLISFVLYSATGAWKDSPSNYSTRKACCCGRSGNANFPYKDRQGNHLH